MKKLVLLFLLLTFIVLMNGCAGSCQRIKANGSVVGTKNGNWIVIKQSGGIITDVYKLENTLVMSEAGSDGWLFLDCNGNPVHLGGDMKAIRLNTGDKDKIFDKYVEYHLEFEDVTYSEKLKMHE